MAEGRRPLTVWCFGRQAGTLAETPTGMGFAYAPDWVAGDMPPLSQSLPLDGSFTDAAADAFFGGLLPEGEPRRQLARLVGVSEDNDYSMLATIAGDTAGAITLLPEGEGPRPVVDDIEWLDDESLVSLLAELPFRPMHVDEDGEYRPEYVRARHLDQLLDEAGLGAAAARRRLRGLARNGPAAAREAREQLIQAAWDTPVLERIVALVDQRAQWILEITAPQAKSSTR